MYLSLFLCLLADGPLRPIPEVALASEAVNVREFSEIAKIKKVVKLQVTANSLIGFVSQVAIDPTSNNLYVGDFDSTGSILLFSEAGSFIRQISKRGSGPGEFKATIQGFSILDDGTLIVLTSTQLMRFDQHGVFQKEINLTGITTPFKLAHLGDTLMVSTLRNYGENGELVMSDRSLNKLTYIGEADPRTMKYLFVPYRNICTFGKEFWVSKLYDMTIVVYDARGKALRKYAFPQANKQKLDETWQAPTFTENHRTTIKTYLHRFLTLMPFGDRVLAFDFVKEPETHMHMYAFSAENKMQLFTGYHFLNRDYAGKSLYFAALAGNAGSDLIGVLDHDEHNTFLCAKYPEIKRAVQKSDDNQLLVFFGPRTTKAGKNVR